MKQLELHWPQAAHESPTALADSAPAADSSPLERLFSRLVAAAEALHVEANDAKRNSALLLGRRLDATGKAPMGFVPLTPPAEKHGDELVAYEGESHLLTMGKTGSGKTALAISNLLSYEGSVICFDSTGTIHEATARRRRELGQEVHVVDFRDHPAVTGGCLNPLDLAARGGREKAVIARSLAAQLVARKGTEPDSFWLDTAETVITGGIAHALEQSASKRNMNTVYDLFHGNDVAYQLAVLLDTKGPKLMNRTAYTAIAALLQLPEKETRPSAIGTVQSVLRLWDSEMVRRLTGRTSFDIDALIHGADARPMSIFIIVPSYREAFRPLLRLMFSALLGAFMQRKRLPKINTLLLADETASFGKVESFVTAATQARQFGLQLWTFWQNAAQLEIYGKEGAHTLVDNAGVLQLLGAPNRRAAQEFADLVGGITADEIMALGPLDQVLFMEGEVRKLRRLRYFEEKRFEGMYDAPGRQRSR